MNARTDLQPNQSRAGLGTSPAGLAEVAEAPHRARYAAHLAVAATLLWCVPGVGAQEPPQRAPVDWPQFRPTTVLAFGEPVIPIFEGWIPNPDGTITLSFGYFNLNTEETVHVPLGADNYIEPREFDGLQPTFFEVAPLEPGRQLRHESTFAITVPGDFRDTLVWTLRIRGEEYSAPARADHDEFDMQDFESLTFAPEAPVLSFGEDGPSGRGRRGPTADPLPARVGEPFDLSIGVDLLSRPGTTLTWYHHQGPAEVDFSQKAIEVDSSGEVTTTVTFSEPGDYVFRATALEHLGALMQHCCWTNAYARVTVTR